MLRIVTLIFSLILLTFNIYMLKAIYDSFRRLDEKVTKLEKNINNANNLVKAVSSRAKSIIAEVDSELTIKKESYTEVANED